MKRLVTILSLMITIALAAPARAQPVCRPPTLPMPGAPQVEAARPGCPNQPGPLGFELYEDCHAIKIDSTGAVTVLQCVVTDPVTGCPAFVLDGTTSFAPGWVRIHEGAITAPVSDLLHFYANHFVSFCSDGPETPGVPPDPADVGIPPIPAGDPDPIVDIVEDITPVLYDCGTTRYRIFSDPPEPTAVPRTSWGRLKVLYR